MYHPTVILLALALAVAHGASGGVASGPLPPIVFASRDPGPAGVVPGVGPAGRALVTGGRLLRREPDGRVRELVPNGALFDVAHPAVSPDAKRVAFAGVADSAGHWRIWVVPARGGEPRCVTGSGSDARAWDDFDPCWVDGHRICFASTRWSWVAEYGGGAVTNLCVLDLESGAVRRLTSERNGAEKPSFDARTGRILFSRWWHNRWRATAQGITADSAAGGPGTTPSLWHAMEIGADGRGERLACGASADRGASIAYAPVLLRDGAIVAVFAVNPALVPAPRGLGIARFAPPRRRAGRRIAGAATPEDSAAAPYGSPRGLAAPAAVAPVALPDGRVLFAYDPSGRGDFGLWAMREDGSHRVRILDLPGTLETDPAPVVARIPGAAVPAPAATLPDRDPPRTRADLDANPGRFHFVNLDVFSGPLSPRHVPGARLRFFAALARPATAGGDTAILLREAAVGGGRVDERDLPARVPLFEQLVDSGGRVLATGRGPAHVAGFNSGAPGETVRCLGCHVGHSTRLRGPGR